MKDTRSQSGFLDLARAVFDAPELQAGLNLVTPLDEEVQSAIRVDVSDVGLGFYLFNYRLLRQAARELLVLVDGAIRPGDDKCSFARRVATEVAQCKKVTCVSEDIAEQSKHDVNGVEIQFWTPRDLYGRLLTLPPTFDAQLESVASIQRQREFRPGFQLRMGQVLNMAGRRPPANPIQLSNYFKEWLGARSRHSPVLLLGERGSGKSWQMLRFALDASQLHSESPWQYGPAFFVKLKDLVDVLEHASGASPVVCEYLFQHHHGLSTAFGGPATLGALFGTGHAVLLVDGFDEMDVAPSEERVRARLTSLLLLLSKRTKFILSCRPGHFASLSALYNAPAWSGATMGQTFETIEIVPYDENRKVAYVEAVGGDASQRIRRILHLENRQGTPLERALSVCASHPGLLAQMKDDIARGIEKPLELIGEAIFSILVEFNILHGRTRVDFRLEDDAFAPWPGLPAKKWTRLSEDRRAELLGDLAWYMAERKMEAVNLANLPQRIRLEYGILGDALERDLRSQTVLELVNNREHAQRTAAFDTVSVHDIGDNGHPEEPESETASVARFTIRNPERHDTSVGESSVAGAYFLCRRILYRMFEPGPFGELPAEVRLKPLGQVPLGPLGADMLREMCRSVGKSPRSLGEQAWRLVVRLAAAGDYRVFSRCYRHLVANLVQIGGLSEAEGSILEPWKPRVCQVVRNPLQKNMAKHELALIPPPLENCGTSRKPFLLGVHEITNTEYLRFVKSKPTKKEVDCTVDGSEWSVGRVTVAGSGSEEGRSENARLTNEYHLFLWLPTGGRSSKVRNGNVGTKHGQVGFVPPTGIRSHPVTYVSWYAAAAFCDWLSLEDDLPRYYKQELFAALGRQYEKPSGDAVDYSLGYRLATRAEWVWAAKAGRESLQRPWDAYPYHLEEASGIDLDVEGTPPGVVDESAWERFARYRRITRAVLLGAGKQAREVMSDEPNDYGVSGLMGNVREWCQDTPGTDAVAEERLVVGVTGFLGEDTFDFDYKTPLYPRNTNPDVGFRIARTLSDKDFQALNSRQNELKHLPPTVPDGLSKASESKSEEGG